MLTAAELAKEPCEELNHNPATSSFSLSHGWLSPVFVCLEVGMGKMSCVDIP